MTNEQYKVKAYEVINNCFRLAKKYEFKALSDEEFDNLIHDANIYAKETKEPYFGRIFAEYVVDMYTRIAREEELRCQKEQTKM